MSLQAVYYALLFDVRRLSRVASRRALQARGVLVSRLGQDVETATGHCINSSCLSLVLQ
ncbi:hypothetical protein LXA43DRAFT_1031698 [Ganoderma leucocontextum]|nr:hypothetical protein LXA43DRAFT_1031698 [Ganoderma leucocontextum]